MLKIDTYSVTEALRDGCQVEIRALRPEDRADLLAAERQGANMPRRCARAASVRPSTPIRGRRGYSDHVSEADPANGAASMRSSFLTPRWREMDSNL